MISVKNLSKTFPSHGRVVDQLTFDVVEGECLVLAGRSGCGKSTLLKMINRLVQPDGGEIRIGGERVELGEVTLIRRKIGYVIQQGGLFPHLNVFENISIMAKLDGWPQARIQSCVERLLEIVGLDTRRDAGKYPRQLSGGEQQRVGVARSLMLDPPILLMDEPFGALDPITRRQLQKDFLKLRKQLTKRKTIVFVTHDMAEAMLMANRIAIMDQGKFLQVGTPEEIRKNPAVDFVADFFGGAV